MSFSVDVNVLLYASDRSSPHHGTARDFLAERLSGREILYLGWLTAMSYLRIATHPRIFASPLSPGEALDNLLGLVDRPNVRPIGEQPGFLEVYAEVAGTATARGNLVPDAHLAALLLQHGIRTIYTNDNDFRRFPFLKVENPFG